MLLGQHTPVAGGQSISSVSLHDGETTETPQGLGSHRQKADVRYEVSQRKSPDFGNAFGFDHF